MQRAKFRQGTRRWDLWTGHREAHIRLEGVPVVMGHRPRALGRWPESHHCRFPVTLAMLTSTFGPWALQNVLDMAVGAAGLICTGIVQVLLVGGEKGDNFYENVFPMFSGRQTDSFLLIPSNLLPSPFGISCLPCLYSQLQDQSYLHQSPSLIYLNFLRMSIQGQHLGWCLNVCLFPSIWSSFQVLFPLIAWIIFAVSGNELMPKTIVHHVLYCLNKVSAVRCLFCPLKWDCLSSVREMSSATVLVYSEFHARKVLQVLLWFGYIWCAEWHLKWTQGWRMCPFFQL